MHFSVSVVLTSLLAGTAMAAKLNIVAVGASITYGLKSVGGNGYRDDLFSALQKSGNQVHMVGTQKSGTMSQPFSEGYPGFTIDKVKAKITENWNKLQYPPNVIVTLVGTNDQIPGKNLACGSVDRFGGLLDQYLSLCPDCTIVASTLPPNGNAKENKNIDNYNTGITKLVADRQAKGQHILIVNGNKGLSLATDFSQDKTHPNNQGYGMIGSRFADQVQSAIDKGWIATPQKFKKRDVWGARANLDFGS